MKRQPWKQKPELRPRLKLPDKLQLMKMQDSRPNSPELSRELPRLKPTSSLLNRKLPRRPQKPMPNTKLKWLLMPLVMLLEKRNWKSKESREKKSIKMLLHSLLNKPRLPLKRRPRIREDNFWRKLRNPRLLLSKLQLLLAWPPRRKNMTD